MHLDLYLLHLIAQQIMDYMMVVVVVVVEHMTDVYM